MHSVVSPFTKKFLHHRNSITDSFQQLPAHLPRKITRAITSTARSSLMTTPPPLPRRTLGQTGLEVSVLGFGASPLGGVFQVKAEKKQYLKKKNLS
jgi:hypothetical protein